MKRIGDILTRNKTAVVVEDDTSYKQVTIRTNYKGVCLRGMQDGSTILTKNQFVVSAGQFILSRIDARNGAFGIIPDELEGAIVTNDFLAFDINEDEVEIEFFNVFLQSPVFLEACIRASRGNTNRKRVDEDFFLNYRVNLPPLKEQSQLIKRVNKGRSAIAAAQHEITYQETLLAKLRQAILEEAIQGRLTADWRATHADVEPTSQLLHRIKAEKARLIAAKKIRPEEPLPNITPTEIPFEIPQGWDWARMGELSLIERGGSPRPIKDFITTSKDGLNWIKIGDTDQGSKFITSTKEKVRKEALSKTRMVFPGDFLLTNSMSFGRPYITQIEGCIHDGWLRIHPSECLEKEFLFWLLSSSFVMGSFRRSAAGAVVQNLNSDKVRELVVPIPPLAEQATIVARVEALMEHCQALEAEIEHARTHATHLLQAVLKEAFAPTSTNG